MNELKVFRITGSAVEKYLDSVAQLRIRVFHDFPYLYDGNTDHEKSYLGRYLQAKDFALIIAEDQKQIVGASTCLPLSQETDEIRLPLTEAGFKEDEVLYLGESVLDEAYRGQGIGKAFFRLREEHGKNQGKKYASFCAVDRPEDHPLRPKNYQPLHGFWKKFRYMPLPQVQATLEWKDIDQKEETEKKLTFWIKEL